MPKFVLNTNAVLYFQNNDEYCFLWYIVAVTNTHYVNPCKTSSCAHLSRVLNNDDIRFSVASQNISKFVKILFQ